MNSILKLTKLTFAFATAFALLSSPAFALDSENPAAADEWTNVSCKYVDSKYTNVKLRCLSQIDLKVNGKVRHFDIDSYFSVTDGFYTSVTAPRSREIYPNNGPSTKWCPGFFIIPTCIYTREITSGSRPWMPGEPLLETPKKFKLELKTSFQINGPHPLKDGNQMNLKVKLKVLEQEVESANE